MDVITDWLQQHAGKVILLVIVMAIAMIATKVVVRVTNEVLGRASIPNASIFANILRVIIWAAAITIVLQPVFGVNPTTILAALGVGGVAISLGMQDTIANIISGFGLMLGKVIQPGDLVRIQGTTGMVKDITWRQTVILERGGNQMVIPNSVLEHVVDWKKLTQASEGYCRRRSRWPWARPEGGRAARAGRGRQATEGMRLENAPTLVKFTGFTPYGITAEVQVYARLTCSLHRGRCRGAGAGRGRLHRTACRHRSDRRGVVAGQIGRTSIGR